MSKTCTAPKISTSIHSPSHQHNYDSHVPSKSYLTSGCYQPKQQRRQPPPPPAKTSYCSSAHNTTTLATVHTNSSPSLTTTQPHTFLLPCIPLIKLAYLPLAPPPLASLSKNVPLAVHHTLALYSVTIHSLIPSILSLPPTLLPFFHRQLRMLPKQLLVSPWFLYLRHERKGDGRVTGKSKDKIFAWLS